MIKKYLVIGNPIEHSLSPKLHNYWLKENKIEATYDKEKLNKEDLQKIIFQVKEKKINGLNITVPFKKELIPYLDELSNESARTQSVNTVYLKNDKIIGHNTDIYGFEFAIKNKRFNVSNKKIFIIGAGGVVSSIIFALNKMGARNITLSNRTKSKAESLKNLFNNLAVVDWGEIPQFDMIINATSVGLKNDEKIDLDFSKIEKGKFFYDVIYNPKMTNFLKSAKEMGNQIENGKRMFIYQAAEAFRIWHGILPKINLEVERLLDK